MITTINLVTLGNIIIITMMIIIIIIIICSSIMVLVQRCLMGARGLPSVPPQVDEIPQDALYTHLSRVRGAPKLMRPQSRASCPTPCTILTLMTLGLTCVRHDPAIG